MPYDLARLSEDPHFAKKRLEAAENVCKTKAAFNNRAEAKAQMKRNHFRGIIYPCPFCDFFHVTTIDKARFRQVKAEIRVAQRTLEQHHDCNRKDSFQPA